MKIHILYQFQDGPWGGGNQFLKALRQQFKKQGVYTEDIAEADAVFFNSHHMIKKLIKIKKEFPNKIFIHRIDGPIFKIRGRDLIIDKLIYQINDSIADGTVFQTDWSRQANYELGMKKNNFETVILNASNKKIFNLEEKVPFNQNRKTRLIATCWAPNMSKGFDIYKYLDENLDFTKFEMTFVGNSPIEFKNIRWIKPVPSEKLAAILKQHDIFVTASRNDPCSNSLIEALSCGLPAIALNDGGHPELIGEGGELFENEHDIIKKIDKVVNNYDIYQKKIPEFSIEKITEKYYNFAKEIFDKLSNHDYQTKKIKFIDKVKIFVNNFIKFNLKFINKIKWEYGKK